MADTTTDVGTTTYTGPDPGMGQYGILSNAAHLAMTNAQTEIQNNRNSLYRGAGVTQNGDSWTVDPNGQGTYQSVMQGNAMQGAADSAAFGSLGFGGGLKTQMQEQAQTSYSQHAADWLNQMTTGTTNLNNQDTQNVNLENTTNFNNLMSDITTAIANHQFNPANYTGITIPGYDVQGDLSKIDPSQIPSDPGFIGDGTTTSGGGGMHGGVRLADHPHYADAVKAGYGKNYAAWVAAGRPKR
jgi:hypothetical protein